MRRRLQAYLKDWRGPLGGHVHQAQQILRRVIVGRLTFTPTDAGYYTFAGTETVQLLLAGAVRSSASLLPGSWNQMTTWLRQIEALRRQFRLRFGRSTG